MDPPSIETFKQRRELRGRHARSAIAEWRQDFNTARPHSSLGYQTPAALAGTLTATGSDASLDRGFASPPVAQPAPYGVTETAEALFVATPYVTVPMPCPQLELTSGEQELGRIDVPTTQLKLR